MQLGMFGVGSSHLQTSAMFCIGYYSCDGGIAIHHRKGMSSPNVSEVFAQAAFEVSNANIFHDYIHVIYGHKGKRASQAVFTRVQWGSMNKHWKELGREGRDWSRQE